MLQREQYTAYNSTNFDIAVIPRHMDELWHDGHAYVFWLWIFSMDNSVSAYNSAHYYNMETA